MTETYRAEEIEAYCPNDLPEAPSNQHIDIDALVNNNLRARFAAVAVKAYARRTRSGGEPLDQVISDLLGDLHHLADALRTSGLADAENPDDADDVDSLLSRGFRHYSAEIRGEL